MAGKSFSYPSSLKSLQPGELSKIKMGTNIIWKSEVLSVGSMLPVHLVAAAQNCSIFLKKPNP